MSIKIKLAEQYVPGNIKNFLQICKIYYYPPEQNYPTDKIWIYFDGEENKQPRTIRSLCFKNPENHQKFIMNNIYAHIYQLLKRVEYNNALSNHIPKIKYQEALLTDLLIKIRTKIPEMWKKEMEQIKLTNQTHTS